EGKNFAPLRQIYYSLILAKWYKETIKNSLLSKVYVDKNKITGVDLEDRTMKEQIYDRYMKAYKKGVYDYIKEDYDAASQEVIPRKYFSGGEVFHTIPLKRDPAILARKIEKFLGKGFVAAVTLTASTVLTAVSSPDLRGQAIVPLGQTSVVNDVPTEQAKDVISYNQATLDKWRSHYTDKQVSWPEVLKGGLSLIYAKAARIYYDELPEKIRRIQERQTNKQTPSQYWDERWELLRSMARSEEKFQPSKDGMFVGGYPKVVSEYINQSLGSVIREILTKDPNKKLNILEIGAGDRFATIEHIAQTYAGHIDKLHTLDPAKPAKPFEGSTHFIGLAEDTGLPDNEYDLVTMFYTLSYTDMDKTLKELIRILRPGGKVIIVDHSGNAGVLNNHYLGFYVDMLSLKTLEQLKSNLKALLKSGDLGHVSPLEFSDFDLKKLAYKDFDFAHIPGFLPMLDGRNKFIREEIVEVINGSVQAENLDKKLIQKIMAKTVRRINGIVKYDAYTTRVTRNLFENTFDDPKSLTEYIRARGFDLEFNEVKGFAQLLPISKRDTIISPYAWGYVIKNFKKEQSFNDLSPEMKFLISLVGIGSIVGISVIIRSLIATAKDFKTIDILIKQHKNLVEGITPSVDPYRYLDEEFSLKRPAERLQIINNLLMPTNDEEVKKILPLLDDPYQEVRDRLVQILRWGVGELKISEDMKRTIYQVFVKILKDPKFSNLERGRIAKVLGDSGNRKYIIELEEALYKDTIDDNAQEFLLTNEDEIFQDEKELFIEEKKSEYFSKFLSHGDVMLALFKLGEKQYFVVFKKLLFLGYFIDSICDALAEKGSVGEIQEALEILIDQIKNIPKGSNTSEGHTEEYEVNSQYVNVQKAIHQLQKALKERASENGKPPDKALLVMSPVLLEMDGNVGKEAKTPGGIDLNTIDLNRQGSGADIQFDPAMMSEILENGVDGFRPVIINFTPITSVLPLLGLEPKGREESYEVSHLN
ncbi:MAG TPA: hypothetical protein DD723_04665, partial [Candidatus Omnitrophica bacterium]|nr:hypothetical protein [Candidatus Omnitrophota bacterium]